MEKTNLLFGSSIKKPALEMEKSNFYDSSNKKVLDVQLMDNAQE
jgi:hypothetical protein